MIPSVQFMQKLEDRRNTWQTNSARINASISTVFTKPLIASLDKKLSAIVNDNASLKSKVKRLQLLTSETRQPIEEFLPCKMGCSNCCHGQIEITQAEAELIGESVGRAPNRLAPGVTTTPMEALGRPDTPCTFLVNQRCSIYEVRPVVCRNHVVVDVDNLLCSFENWALSTAKDSRAIPFPKLDAGPILAAYRQMATAKRQAYADIRQFFPVDKP